MLARPVAVRNPARTQRSVHAHQRFLLAYAFDRFSRGLRHIDHSRCGGEGCGGSRVGRFDRLRLPWDENIERTRFNIIFTCDASKMILFRRDNICTLTKAHSNNFVHVRTIHFALPPMLLPRSRTAASSSAPTPYPHPSSCL